MLASLRGLIVRGPMLGTQHAYVLAAHQQRIVTVNGVFRPFALVRGRAVATWAMPAGEVVLKPFAALTGGDERALRADAQDVVRYLVAQRC